MYNMENIVKNTYDHIPPHSTRAREVYTTHGESQKRLQSLARGRLRRLLEKAHAAGYGMRAATYGDALHRIDEMGTAEQFEDFCDDTRYLRQCLAKAVKNKTQSFYFVRSARDE